MQINDAAGNFWSVIAGSVTLEHVGLKKMRRQLASICLIEHDEGDGEALFRAACRMGLEGIVSKRAQSRYRSGRCKSWIKTKNRRAPGYMRVRDGLDG